MKKNIVTKENRSDSVEQKKSPAVNRANFIAYEAGNLHKHVVANLANNIAPHKFNRNEFMRNYV